MSFTDRLYARDVGLRRLHTAVAATVTTFVSLAVLLGLGAVLGRGASFAIPGVVVTAIATMGVGMDPDTRHRTTTTVLMAAPGVVGLVLGATTDGHRLATAAVFMGLAVATLAASLLGSRGILLALSAIGAFYGAGLADVPLQDLPVYALAIAVGAVVSAVLLGPVLGSRPAREPARLLCSIRSLAGRVRAAAAAGDRGRTRSALDRVEVAVATARAHVEAHPAHWPAALRRHGGAVLGTYALRLQEAAAHVLAGGDLVALDALVADPLLSSTGSGGRGGAPSGILDADHSAASPPPAASSTPSSVPSPALSAALGGRSQVSMAVQLTVATAAALVVSMLIDPDRWFWGVLAAQVMLFGTSSAAEAIGKGGRRVLGTALALPVGAVLAHLAHPSLLVVVVLMIVVMFFQQYLAEVAYGWSVFYLTLFLYLVFALSGPAAADVLGVRLLQTAAGAGVGVAVALLVLPTRTGALLAGRALDVVSAADSLLERVAQRAPVQDVVSAGRETTRRFEQLTADADASRRGWPFSPAHPVVGRQLAAAAVLVRELRTVVDDYDDDDHDGGQGLSAASVATAGAIRLRLQDVRAGLEAGLIRRRSSAAAKGAAGAGPEELTLGSPDGPDGSLDQTLKRIYQSVSVLQAVLADGDNHRSPSR